MPQQPLDLKPVQLDLKPVNPIGSDPFQDAVNFGDTSKETPWYTDLWNKATTPLTDFFSRSFESVSPGVNESSHPLARFGKFGSQILDSLTSPLDLGLAAASGGSSIAARTGFKGAAKGLSLAEKALSAPVAGHGAINIVHPDSTMLERGTGALELLGGGAGLLSKTPTVKTFDDIPEPKTFDDIPLRGTPDNSGVGKWDVDEAGDPFHVVDEATPPSNQLDLTPVDPVSPKASVIKIKKPTEEIIAKAEAEGYILSDVDDQGRVIMTLNKSDNVPSTVDTPTVKNEPTSAQLPRDLKDAKPRFNIGENSYTPDFESDLDKALFIISQKTPSKRDKDYLKFVMDNLGIDEQAARQMGQIVRTRIKSVLKGQEPGNVRIPASGNLTPTSSGLKPTVGNDFTAALQGSLKQKSPQQILNEEALARRRALKGNKPLSDWVEKLVKDESGEFDPSALFKRFISEEDGSIEDLSKLKARAEGLFTTDPKRYTNQKITTDVPTLRAEIANGFEWENGLVKGGKTINPNGLYPKTTLVQEINTLAERRALEEELKLLPKKGEIALGSKRGRQLEKKRNSLIEKINQLITDESGEADLGRLKELFDKHTKGTLTPEELLEAKNIAKQIGKTTGQSNEGGGIPSSANAGEGPIPIWKQQDIIEGKAKTTPEDVAQQVEIDEAAGQPSKLRELYELSRGLMSVDAPFLTSAAFRQASPLVGTKNWFKAWEKATKSFGSETTFNKIIEKIESRPLFQKGVDPTTGKPTKSYAEEVGLRMTSLKNLNSREEAIRSQWAEKIPGYGQYVRSSNRAYTAFLDSLRADQLETLVDQAKRNGLDPETNLVLGRQIADVINDSTGRSSLKQTVPFTGGKELSLDISTRDPRGRVAQLLTDTLWSPRLLNRKIRMLNPANYANVDPFVRQEMINNLLRSAGNWAAFTGMLALAGGEVSWNPTNSDFGKIKFDNTRIDPGAGLLQLMVLSARLAPDIIEQITGIPTGHVTSSTSKRKTEYGTNPFVGDRITTSANFVANQAHPTLKLAIDFGRATSENPINITDRVVQNFLPLFTQDLAEIMQNDPDLVKLFFSGVGGSIGLGTQTYDGKSFGKPVYVPSEWDMRFPSR